MRTAVSLGFGAALALLAGGVLAGQSSPPAASAPKPAPKPATTARPAPVKPAARPGGIRYIASVRDIMHVMIEPAADKIFDAVAIDVTEAGVREKKPETDEEWDELEHNALALAESVNLIKMADRPMARTTEMNVDPEGPELPPAQIEARVRRSRALWNKYADALQDSALHVLQLVEKKDAKGLFEYGGDLDKACENCHLEYWYPDDKKNRK